MSASDILFAKKALSKAKAASQSPLNAFDRKSEARERKRNLLYLIQSYLVEQKYFEAADALRDEAQLVADYQVCENVDLDIVLQEYQSYYFARFQKYPKIVKKIEDAPTGGGAKPRKKPAETKPLPIKTDAPSTEKFEIDVKSLAQFESPRPVAVEEKQALEEYADSYPPDWREMAAQIKKDFVRSATDTTWTDCVGLGDVVEKLKEAVVYPRSYPHLFRDAAPWKGVLLFGPPGTGKTLLAKALASEGGTFINVTSSTFTSKWRGESEKMINVLFRLAERYAPTVVFIDEVDALAFADELSHHEASRRFKSELLTQIDGVLESRRDVFVLGSTNSPWNLDPALLRRFEKRILVPLPDELSRRKLVSKYLAEANELDEADLQRVAKRTEKFSGSDVKGLCKEVAMIAIREKIREIGANGTNRTHTNLRKVSFKDVEKALETIGTCVRDSDCAKYDEWNRKYGSW
ncbi:unnamed protein product [Phyllotreta striolata]|uniref:AAA+ ATPase domain-containing protein n=1 Tax=Phyllotreta striolata TaxID=444603 RepID=A0A9N9TUS3_PHYSR|nr:unnamed protein product [Phyllotreta striolata]